MPFHRENPISVACLGPVSTSHVLKTARIPTFDALWRIGHLSFIFGCKFSINSCEFGFIFWVEMSIFLRAVIVLSCGVGWGIVVKKSAGPRHITRESPAFAYQVTDARYSCPISIMPLFTTNFSCFSWHLKLMIMKLETGWRSVPSSFRRFESHLLEIKTYLWKWGHGWHKCELVKRNTYLIYKSAREI